MRLLDGSELAGFIKERQAKQVRALRQAHAVQPRLVILRTHPDPVVDSSMKLKQAYGTEILIEVDILTVEQSEVIETISQLNHDLTVHGIIVQLPLADPDQTDEVLNAVVPAKDVDGLGKDAVLDAAAPLAINWLLAGYNINLQGKNIVIVGHGRLVGRPLASMWEASGLNVMAADKATTDLAETTRQADILVCATGVPGLIKTDMVKPDAVIVDAGMATDKNGVVGDVAADVRQLPGITITPEKGGVGPLTICALFDNVIRAARKEVKHD